MNEKLLNTALRELQLAANLDFALSSADFFGADTAEVQRNLADKYGDHAKGIWIRRWMRNAQGEKDANSSNTLFVKCVGLTQPEMQDIMAAFVALRYTVTPCTGNYNLSGHFTIEENTSFLAARMPFLVDVPAGVLAAFSGCPKEDGQTPGLTVNLITPTASEPAARLEFGQKDCCLENNSVRNWAVSV